MAEYMQIDLTEDARASEQILTAGHYVLDFEVVTGTATLHLIDAGATNSRSIQQRSGPQKENISKYAAFQFETVKGAIVKYRIYTPN